MSFRLKEARTFEPDAKQHLSKAHVQHIEKLLEVNPISKVETRSSQYHKAIIKGRHPRSFKRRDLQTASLWSFVSTSSDRVKNCYAGQIVKDVADEEVQLPQESDIGKEEKSAASSKSNGHSHKLQKAAKKLQRLNSMRRLSSMRHTKEERDMLEEKKKVQRRRNMENRLFKKKYGTLYKEIENPDTNPNRHITAKKITETDFNTMKDTKIFYRSTVAFQLVSDGTWLTVDHRKKRQVCARDRDLGGQFMFRIINLKYPKDVKPICYDDEVWLLVVPGSKSSDGLVLGTFCKKAFRAFNKNSERKTGSITLGKLRVFPARTYTEQGTHDLSVQTNKHNEGALAVGMLRIRKFSPNERTPFNEKKVCTNLSLVSLEQDFYYVAVDEKTRDVVLRKSSNGGDDDFGVDSGVGSGGVWKLHLIEDGATDSEHPEIYRTRQRLLYKARVQLQDSAQLRLGQTKRAKKMKERDTIIPGSKFVPSIRACRQQVELSAERKVIVDGGQKMSKFKKDVHNPFPINDSNFKKGKNKVSSLPANTAESPSIRTSKRKSPKNRKKKLSPRRGRLSNPWLANTTLGLLRHSYRDNTLANGTCGEVASAVVEAAAATARASVRTARARSPRAGQPYSVGFSKGSSPTDNGSARFKDEEEPMQLTVPNRLRRNSIKNFGVSVREYKNRVHRKQQKHSQAISRKKMEQAYRKWLATQDNVAEMTPFQKCHYELNKCSKQVAKKLSDESERRFPKGFFEGSSEAQQSLPGESNSYWRDRLLVQDDQVVKFVAAVAKENEQVSAKKKQPSPDLEQFPHPVYLL